MDLRFFLVTLIAISQCMGNELIKTDVEKDLREFLESEVEGLKSVQNEVEVILQNLEAKSKGNIREREPIKEGGSSSCLNLLAAADPPCPDLQDLIGQVKTVLGELANLVSAGIQSFNNTFKNPDFNCTNTINPLKALRCFLRAFKEAYDNLSELKAQISKLQNDVHTLVTEYEEYQSCEHPKTNLRFRSQIQDLCNKIHQTNYV